MHDEITIGQKIKKHRKERRMTQQALAEGIITRNMLSLIESDKAKPSFEVSKCIAEKLSLPLAYLYSGKDDLFFYQKNDILLFLKELLKKKDYLYAVNTALKITSSDDEINFIITICAFNYGKECIYKGMLQTAVKYLKLAQEKSKLTIYPTEDINALILLYLSIAENIHSPLLEFNINAFEESFVKTSEIEFFKYVTLDFDFQYKNKLFREHINAKALIKARKYREALAILKDIADNKSDYDYNAYAIFGIYSDLEALYRQLEDFENAYRFSSKRISLLSSFNS